MCICPPVLRWQVGSRHGKPVVLVVDARKMAAAGSVFHIADNAVWLTDSVPAIYLRELADSAHAGMENESGVK